MNFAPIALFAYNRKVHLKKTIDSLTLNSEAKSTDLFIFSDGWKGEVDKESVKEVRDYLKTVSGFKSVAVVESEKNNGLGKSIIAGVSKIIKERGEVIVLEDDLILSPFFLKFMNEGLNLYRDSSKVASIHGYSYPVTVELPETFFIKGADCLGWATWDRAWKLFEPDAKKLYYLLIEQKKMDEFNFFGAAFKERILERVIAGKNDSWAARWDASIFLLDMLTLYPKKSLVHHIGADGGGTNTKKTKILDVELYNHPISVQKVPEIPCDEAYFAIGKFYLLFKFYNPFKRIKFYLKSKNLLQRR